MTNRLRIVGAVLGILSYALLVSNFVTAGVLTNIATQAFLTPFNVQHKAWDMVGTGGFFTAVNLAKLLT